MINPSLKEHTNALANYLPNTPLFEAKNIHDSNFRQLLSGLAGELFTAQGYLVTLNNEYLPDETVLFIDEWESALGIPDSCFSGTGTLNERRRDVLVKLASLGIQTASDFEELGDIFGVSITVVEGSQVFSVFPLTFPFTFFDSLEEARFTIVVEFTFPESSKFPLTFPFVFGDAEIGILECLFRKLKPANCDIIFRQV